MYQNSRICLKYQKESQITYKVCQLNLSIHREVIDVKSQFIFLFSTIQELLYI